MAKKTISELVVEAAYGGYDPLDNIPSGTQQPHITDASTAHDVTGSDSVDQTELENALNTLGTKINKILATLEEYKQVASS